MKKLKRGAKRAKREKPPAKSVFDDMERLQRAIADLNVAKWQCMGSRNQDVPEILVTALITPGAKDMEQGDQTARDITELLRWHLSHSILQSRLEVAHLNAHKLCTAAKGGGHAT